MKIIISGGSGFIGSHIIKYFESKGHEIISLNRGVFQNSASDKLRDALCMADIVINLAGASINHRWSESYKRKMYESRILITRRIVEVINSNDHKPMLFISASAVGFYADRGCHDEYSGEKGDGFLADLCEQWELEAQKISPDVRLVITRFGVVLNQDGGAFIKLSLPARFKVATIVGPGNQLLPWIYLNDLIKAIEHIINQPSLKGVINFVAPGRITNRELIEAIGWYERSFITITIPEFFFHILLGEAADFVTKGQCVIPKKLLDSDFIFEAPTIRKFIDLLPS